MSFRRDHELAGKKITNKNEELADQLIFGLKLELLSSSLSFWTVTASQPGSSFMFEPTAGSLDLCKEAELRTHSSEPWPFVPGGSWFVSRFLTVCSSHLSCAARLELRFRLTGRLFRTGAECSRLMSAHQLLRAFIHGETGQHHQAMERKGLEMNTDSAVKQEDTTDGRENPVRTPISRPSL